MLSCKPHVCFAFSVSNESNFRRIKIRHGFVSGINYPSLKICSKPYVAGPSSHCFVLKNTSPRLRDMKKIEAIIKPFRMDQVREALIEIGVCECTRGEAYPSGPDNPT